MTTDIFDKVKAYNLPDLAKESLGVYPYFQPLGRRGGGTTDIRGEEYLFTGDNDYLGLSQDARLKEAAKDAIDKYGTSCTGSRFLTGTIPLHEEAEEKFADFMGKEAALIFSAGYLSSLGAISGISGRGDLLYLDKENHASLYEGTMLTPARVRKYSHNDLDDLERLLKLDSEKGKGALIISDGVFSMSGHLADTRALVELSRRYGARLLIDDAHGLGVMGEMGRGTCSAQGTLQDIDLIVATFSKSMASIGGVLCGPKHVLDYIKHHARSFMFTAAITAGQVGAVVKALEIMRTEPEHQQQLWRNTKMFTDGLNDLGFDTWGTQTPIIPVVVGSMDRLATFWKVLWEKKIFVTPAVPPAVDADKCLVRTSMTANHEESHIERLLEGFSYAGRKIGLIS